MKPENLPKITLTEAERKLTAGAEEELVDHEEDRMKIPRSGKRQLMPIERLR